MPGTVNEAITLSAFAPPLAAWDSALPELTAPPFRCCFLIIVTAALCGLPGLLSGLLDDVAGRSRWGSCTTANLRTCGARRLGRCAAASARPYAGGCSSTYWRGSTSGACTGKAGVDRPLPDRRR